MFYRSVFLSFIFWLGLFKRGSSHVREDSGDEDFGLGLISSLRDDANLDLSVDEEYEDLRAELLAYQAALASIISHTDSRRSLKSTPCWQIGGICINHKLCRGEFITQVPGCKDRYNVCCFAWNQYFVKDLRDKGLPNLALPWVSIQQEFGGKGVQVKIATTEQPTQKKKKKVHAKKDMVPEGNLRHRYLIDKERAY